MSDIGENCGNCVRGGISRSANKVCQKCWKVELETGKRFTEWEKKI